MTSVVQNVANTQVVGSSQVMTIAATGSSSGLNNSIIICCAISGISAEVTSFTISDNKLNSYNVDVLRANTATLRTAAVISSIKPITGVTTITIDTVPSGTAMGGVISVQEVTGLTGLDQANSNVSVSISAPFSVNLPAPDASLVDYVAGAWSDGSGSSALGIVTPPTYTASGTQQNDDVDVGGQTVYRINSTQNTDSATWSTGTNKGQIGATAVLASYRTYLNQIKFWSNGAVQATAFVQAALPSGVVLRAYANNVVQASLIVTNGGGVIRAFSNGTFLCNNTITV